MARLDDTSGPAPSAMQSPDPCSHEVPLAFSGFIIIAIRVRVTLNVFCVCEAVSNETTLSGEESTSIGALCVSVRWEFTLSRGR